MGWTKQQIEAFSIRGGNILVNAAAGAGKTAVLTERVVRLISEGKDLSRLLIVTFTRAAAAEMRTRIAKNLTDLSLQNPKDRHLRRQYLTLYKAHISTIDSFGIDLLRRNFAAAGMAPDFGVMDETEHDVLANVILDRLTEEFYRTCPPAFFSFLDLFGGEENISAARAAVIRLAESAQNVPFADEWLKSLEGNLERASTWTEVACLLFLPVFREAETLFCAARDSGVYQTAAAVNCIDSDAAFASSARRQAESGDWDGVLRSLNAWDNSAPRISPARCTPLIYRYRKVRDFLHEYKTKDVFWSTAQKCADDLQAVRPAVSFLLSATRRFREDMLAEMHRRNTYTFGALSELALRLTVTDYDRSTGKFTPTAVALAEQASYDEIMIDEYQDVNDVQDLLFRAVSRDNLFAVGDVKQSIYGFRGSNPENFLRRKREKKPITLNKNFRSEAGILSFVNFVFRGLFSAEFGGLKYDKDEQLNPGREPLGEYPFPRGYDDLLETFADGEMGRSVFPEGKSPVSELFLLRNAVYNQDEPDLDVNAAQARVCARLIRDAIEGGATVYDKNDKAVRPMRYSDIAVLLRTNRPTDTFLDVFRRSGIPIRSSRASFLIQPEVYGIIAILEALHDPRDDFYLFIALTGSAFRMTAEQVARLRLSAPRQPLYEGLKVAAQTDPDAARALDRIRYFRILSDNLPVSRLIWEIYSSTDYPALEAAADSEARTRLMKFYSFACRYSGSEGLGGFLTFAKRAQQQPGKREEDSAAPEGDFVTLQTIHGSKGLEYPWCIVCQTHNRDDKDADPLLDRELGLGVYRRDPESRFRDPTLFRSVIRLRGKKDETSELLRNWYVAMTRARDRLTMIGLTPKDPIKKKQYAANCDENGNATYSELFRAPAFLDLLLSRVSLHPDASPLHDGVYAPENETSRLRVAFVTAPPLEERQTQATERTCGLSPEELKRRFDFRYDDHLSLVPAKVSVTEIAKAPADPDSALLIQTPPAARPRFLDGQRLTAAEAGTAMHTYCQFAELFAPPEEQIARLVREGHLTEAEAEVIDRGQIERLQNSPLAERLRAASDVRREVRFVCRIPVSYFSGHPGEEGQMLMQGAMDLLIETEAGYEVIDFKTDRATEEELRERYSRQINLYVTAVEQLYDKPVLGASLWSFRLGKEIPIRRGEM